MVDVKRGCSHPHIQNSFAQFLPNVLDLDEWTYPTHTQDHKIFWKDHYEIFEKIKNVKIYTNAYKSVIFSHQLILDKLNNVLIQKWIRN